MSPVHSENILAVLYRIAERATSADSLAALCGIIRSSLADVMDTENCYVALREEGGKISFPLFHDARDPAPPARPLGRSLTDFVIAQGMPLRLSADGSAQLLREKGFALAGAVPSDWIGAPILREGSVIGMIAIQTYRRGALYTDEDLDVLRLVADRVGVFIRRKQVEEALKRSEARYKAIVDSLESAVCRWLPDTTLTFVSPAYGKLFGRAPDDLLGVRWITLVPESALPEVKSFVQDLVRNPRINTAEHEVVDATGGIRWQRWIDCPIYTHEGRLLEFQSIGTDTTDRRAIEEVQRQARVADGLRRVLLAADELVACRSDDEIRRRAVELARERLGLDRCGLLLVDGEEVIGTYGTDSEGKTSDERDRRFKIHDLEEWVRRVDDMRHGGMRWFAREAESHFEYRDGAMSHFGEGGWVVYTPIAVDGKFVGLFCNDNALKGEALDPAKQETLAVYCSFLGQLIRGRQTEEALRRIEMTQRSILENLRGEYFFYRHGLDGVFTYVSPSINDILGYTESEFLRHFASYLSDSEGNKERVRRHTELSMKGERQPPYEVEVRHKNGTLRCLEVLEVPVADDRGNVVAVEGIAHDITARKKSDATLRAYRESLQSLASEVSLAEERERRRIAVELHDSVGQMLALIRMKMGAVRKGPLSGAGETALAEVFDLLDRTIQSTRTLSFELSPPVLYELGLPAAIEWLAEEFSRRHGIKCRVRKSGSMRALDVETSVMLFQIVRELLYNVAKHAGASQVAIEFRSSAKGFQLSVKDNGKGFTPGRRAASKNGFGLFSVGERLSRLGGNLSVEAAPGKGTQVTLSLPQAATK